MAVLRDVLEAAPGLQALTVRGEISDFRRSSARHLYFVLKDDCSEIRCVMFAKNSLFLRFPPCNGLQVLLQGGLELYGGRGEIQLQVRSMRPDGPGALKLRLDELRARLKQEGLFDRPKRPLAVLPRVVGVVTSKEGAVLRDIASTLRRRNPAVQLVLSPSPVQGAEAPPRLIRALDRVVRFGVDCVIVARGGGSLEDLMAFNDEDLVRAVADCAVPVVSAVGHETDFTLCDLAADRRAPTPTAAAELVAADRGELLAHLGACSARLQRAVCRQLQRQREGLDRLALSPALRYPQRPVQRSREHFQQLDQRLWRCMDGRLERERSSLRGLQTALQAGHPRVRLSFERQRLQALKSLLWAYPRLLATRRERLETLGSRLPTALQRLVQLQRQRLATLKAALRDPRPQLQAEKQQLASLRSRLPAALALRCRSQRELLAGLQASLRPPPVSDLRLRLGALHERLLSLQLRQLERFRERLGSVAGRLHALSPLQVLERGYSYTRDARGNLVRSVLDRQVGEPLSVHLQDGTLECRLEGIRPNGNNLALDPPSGPD